MATAAKPATAGAIYVAAKGATLPTTPSSAVGADFTSLGYVSEDGVTRTISHDSNTVKDWSGKTVLVLNNGKTETFKFTLLDVTEVKAMELVYSTASESSGTISATQGADNRVGHAFVIDMILADNKAQRICIPNGLVTDIGDIGYKSSEAVGYELTITAMCDAAGNTSYDYIK